MCLLLSPIIRVIVFYMYFYLCVRESSFYEEFGHGFAGDMEFKQNKFLSAEKQIVTANPDVNTVSPMYLPIQSSKLFSLMVKKLYITIIVGFCIF